MFDGAVSPFFSFDGCILSGSMTSEDQTVFFSCISCHRGCSVETQALAEGYVPSGTRTCSLMQYGLTCTQPAPSEPQHRLLSVGRSSLQTSTSSWLDLNSFFPPDITFMYSHQECSHILKRCLLMAFSEFLVNCFFVFTVNQVHPYFSFHGFRDFPSFHMLRWHSLPHLWHLWALPKYFSCSFTGTRFHSWMDSDVNFLA